MRFMMLMIPKGYETAPPDTMPDRERVEAMMKYNEALQKAGVLLALDGLHPPSMGARVSFPGGKPDGHRRPVHRSQGSARRLLDDPGEVEARRRSSGRSAARPPRTRSSRSARCRKWPISPRKCRRRPRVSTNCRRATRTRRDERAGSLSPPSPRSEQNNGRGSFGETAYPIVNLPERRNLNAQNK